MATSVTSISIRIIFSRSASSISATEQGAQVEVETDLGDYEKVNGVYFPFSIEAGSKGSTDKQKTIIEKGEANIPVDDSHLRVPGQGHEIIHHLPPCAFLISLFSLHSPSPASLPAQQAPYNSATISGLGARNIGSATMSGRVSAIAATREPSGKLTIFVGAASGGVWKSEDGGTHYRPVFDEQPVQSIGAIALDPKNSKNVWVGTGESWTRNSVSIGDGIYKSTDGGETWTKSGLPNSERIAQDHR